MQRTTIAQYMTSAPISIGIHQTLDAAHALMREHGIRHLPVLDGGDLVGILSARDLDFVETLRDVDPKTVKVEDAMTPDPYVVGPRASLANVAAKMAERKLGSAVVVDRDRVVGLFSTVDALRALSELLRKSQC